MRRQTHVSMASNAATALALAIAVFGSAPARAQEEVILAGYGGTIEQFMRDIAIPICEEQVGAKINYVVGTALSNYSKVLATKDSPEVDLYWSNDLTHLAGKQHDLYAELDPSIVTNLDDVFERAKDPDNIGVASYVSSLGLQYNADKFKEAGLEPPDSWYDLWSPEYEGKVALYTFGIAFSQHLVPLMSQLIAGDQNHADEAFAKLAELAESGNVAVVANTPAEMDNIMLQEQAWVTYNVGLRALLREDSGAPLVYVHPKEGAARFGNFFDVVNGAPHPELAQKLVNCLVSAEVQSQISSGLYVAPINREVALPDKLKGKVPFGDAELEKLINIDLDNLNEHLDQWTERWEREVESKL